MKYRRLTIDNFGPYYGTHVLEFGRERGVWLIYGDNGRGKTTLLNAFRYALYGRILGRRAERRPEEVANSRHTAETGRIEFKTTLEFEHEGEEYRVTRHFQAGRNPDHILIVERGGTPLKDHEANSVMRAVAPESISQFFLFDGELLRQYEDLRDPTMDSGRRMRDEVDRLLGVHSVENAIHDLKEISTEINREKAKVLAANARARNLAVALQEANDKRGALVTALGELQSNQRRHTARLAEVEEALAQHERARESLARIDALKERRTGLEVMQQTAVEDLRALSSTAWQAALLPAVGHRLREIREQVQIVDERRVEAIVARRTEQRLETGLDCPVCETPLDGARREDVLRRARAASPSGEVERLDRLVTYLRKHANTLEQLNDTGAANLLSEREKAVRKLGLELSDVDELIAEQEEGLRGIDQAEVRRRGRERDDLTKLLLGLKDDVVKTNEDIRQQDNVIGRIKDELQRLNVTTDPVLESKDQTAGDLLALFNDALARYQDELLTRVEDEASSLFMSIRAEEEYGRLKIREGYGLSIVDAEGAEVHGHSAGYEHLIALSLIAALKRCSPVQGPIVMDSPFGRLDETHTRNVVAALPRIADQVVLLAFNTEFDRDSAVDALGDSLVAEFSLDRVSARHTKIINGRSRD
jgi:DNA sulfur modification protein DndD